MRGRGARHSSRQASTRCPELGHSWRMAPAPVSWSFGERSWHGGCDEIPLPAGPGRLWLCGKRFVAENPDEALASVEGTRIVCLCERHELEERYPNYVARLKLESERRAI